MEPLVVAIGAVVLIVAVTAFAPRVGVAGPLVLVVIGVGVGFLPGVPRAEIDPEIVVSGVLPPLLYSAAVSMPSMDSAATSARSAPCRWSWSFSARSPSATSWPGWCPGWADRPGSRWARS